MNSSSIMKKDYKTWKENNIRILKEGDSGRHGCQNYFYFTLLINLFEQKYPGDLSHLVVDEKINKLFFDCARDLRCAYGFEWEKAESEASESEKFKNFIISLEENEFIFKKEIKKIAPLIVQDYRTNPDNGFFAIITKKCPDFLIELGSYLEPNLSAEAGKSLLKKCKRRRIFITIFSHFVCKT